MKTAIHNIETLLYKGDDQSGFVPENIFLNLEIKQYKDYATLFLESLLGKGKFILIEIPTDKEFQTFQRVYERIEKRLFHNETGVGLYFRYKLTPEELTSVLRTMSNNFVYTYDYTPAEIYYSLNNYFKIRGNKLHKLIKDELIHDPKARSLSQFVEKNFLEILIIKKQYYISVVEMATKLKMRRKEMKSMFLTYFGLTPTQVLEILRAKISEKKPDILGVDLLRLEFHELNKLSKDSNK